MGWAGREVQQTKGAQIWYKRSGGPARCSRAAAVAGAAVSALSPILLSFPLSLFLEARTTILRARG
jgi:hypothetical protein